MIFLSWQVSPYKWGHAFQITSKKMDITKYPNFHFIAHEAEIHSNQKQTLHLVYDRYSLGEHIFFGKQRLRLLSTCVIWHMCRMMTRVPCDDTCAIWWHICCMMTHVLYGSMCAVTRVPCDDMHAVWWQLCFIMKFKEKTWTHESLFWSKAYTLNNITLRALIQ